MVRLFVGSFLGADEAARVGHFAEAWLPGLKKQLAAGQNARFIKPEKLHMTWLFLGEVEEEKIEAVKSWLAVSVSNLQKQYLQALQESGQASLDIKSSYDTLECWPVRDKARVIVATPSAVPPDLAALGTGLRQQFENWTDDTGPGGGADILKFNKDEPRYVEFRPHLTLMRLSPAADLSDGAVETLLKQLLPVHHQIQDMHLVRSHNDGDKIQSTDRAKGSGGHINGRRQDYEIIASPWPPDNL